MDMWDTPNFVPEYLRGVEPGQLLSFYDNPQNFTIPDNIHEAANLDANTFPKNTTLLLTHGLFSVNSKDRAAVVDQIEATKMDVSGTLLNESDMRDVSKKQAYRLLRNFSDFWTRKVAEQMFAVSGDTWFKTGDDEECELWYPESVIIPKSPRVKWDPARALDAKDFKRDTDFNRNALLPQDYLASDAQWEDSHQAYHSQIKERLAYVEKTQGWSITFDIHDTGVNMMGVDSQNDMFRDWGYPGMEVGTLEWASCNPEILEYFASQVEHYFWFTPQVNQKYKWGYVTQRHGRDGRKEWDEFWTVSNKRNVLQIELGRYLYMKESTQEIDHKQTKKVWAALRMCVQKTGEKFGPKYFAGLS